MLDHKLGNNPNDLITPTTEFAEEVQYRTKLLIDKKTKHNIMQSYIKYKEYYDRKAKAAPLKKMITVLHCSQKWVTRDQRSRSQIIVAIVALDHL